MTKIHKLGKSTFVIAILSFLLVAVLAFGGTYAYFSATAETATAGITVGHLKLGAADFDQTAFTNVGVAVPNQPIMSEANGTNDCTVTVDSNVRYFIRAKVDYKVTLDKAHNGVKDEGEEAADACTCADKGIELLVIADIEDANPGWVAGTTADNKANQTGYYYLTTAQDSTIGETDDVRSHTIIINATVNPKAGQVESQHFMDATITVTVVFQVIQADYILGNGAAVAPDQAVEDVKDLEAAWAEAYKAIGA